MSRYHVCTPAQTLKSYAEWILTQETDDPFFKCIINGKQFLDWYSITYALRTLLYASEITGEFRFADKAVEYVERYLEEQLPNGAFMATFRNKPTSALSKKELNEIFRHGKINVADNGSNVLAVMQSARFVGEERKKRYLDAVKRWFDNWVMTWQLPEGGYTNGIWVGQRVSGPYTGAIATISAAFSCYYRLTGEVEYIRNAEEAIMFQCEHWLEDGRPVFLCPYSSPNKKVLDDFGNSFYLLEGMCQTHSSTGDAGVRDVIEKRLREWIFGEKGLLTQWSGSFFNFIVTPMLPNEGELYSSRLSGVCLTWEMAKANGILAALLYYLRHIDYDERLRQVTEAGVEYLCTPVQARMSGVRSEPDTSYGALAVQSTGFAGLSVAEAITADISWR